MNLRLQQRFILKPILPTAMTLASTIVKSVKGDWLNSDNDGLSLSMIDDNSDNEANDCYCDLVIPSGNHYLRDLTTNLHINLHNVDVFSTEGFCKKVLDLFAVRGVMKTNMHASGTHDSDPWNFVQCIGNCETIWPYPCFGVLFLPTV
jgi:hypothetical protein